MKRTIPTALGLASVLIGSVMATEIPAACYPTKDFKLAYSDPGDYFINFPAGTNSTIGGGVLKGRFWQAGARASVNEGYACPEVTYLLETGPNQLTIFGQMGGDIIGGVCYNEGCAAGSMVMLIQTLSNDGSKAYYAVGKVNETIAEFRFNRGEVDWQMVEIPRPRVTSSTSSYDPILINFVLDPPTGAHGEADGFARNSILTGYQVVTFQGLADPGRNPAAWTNYGPVIPVNDPGGTPVFGASFHCAAQPQDVFIAVRLVFDGGQFLGDYVGASTRLECDPAVAEPRFNGIDRTKSGRGTIRVNPR